MAKNKIRMAVEAGFIPAQKQENSENVNKNTSVAANCTDRRNLGEISTRSPKKLNRASKVADSQKLAGIPSAMEAKTNAASIPMPPPFGTGIGIS